jgi:hypothetical protein
MQYESLYSKNTSQQILTALCKFILTSQQTLF